MALLENKEIILASSSPRRKEILSEIGVKFKVISPECDEILDHTLPLEHAIVDVAQRKCFSITQGDIVIAADTLVTLDGKILGKPKDKEEAFSMLAMLSGKTHEVITGVCMKNHTKVHTFCSKSTVTFFSLSAEEIGHYIHHEHPLDKAGAYGIQDGGSLFIESINGDFYSIMGLPKAKVYRCLKDWEV